MSYRALVCHVEDGVPSVVAGVAVACSCCVREWLCFLDMSPSLSVYGMACLKSDPCVRELSGESSCWPCSLRVALPQLYEQYGWL